jgi:hypothetical protein
MFEGPKNFTKKLEDMNYQILVDRAELVERIMRLIVDRLSYRRILAKRSTKDVEKLNRPVISEKSGKPYDELTAPLEDVLVHIFKEMGEQLHKRCDEMRPDILFEGLA